MQIETIPLIDFSEVLLKPKRSTLHSRKQVDLYRSFATKHPYVSLSGIPVIAANMDTVGTMEAAEVLARHQMFTALHKHYGAEECADFFARADHLSYVFYTMGTSTADYEKFQRVKELLGVSPMVCIDVANGYSEHFIDFCAKMREETDSILMAGNVCTPEITEELILKGVDIVKVGIGGGSQCTTRYVAGVGIPQLSAIIACADAAHGLGGLVCGDGGITCPGDLMKAFGGGADFVMVGGEFAGHDESGGEEIYDDGELVGKMTYGMSSGTAMKKYCGEVNSYRSSEGRTSIVPYRGPLETTIEYYLGGLRSGMTYIGAKSIKEISKRATFVRVGQILNNKYESSTTTLR